MTNIKDKILSEVDSIAPGYVQVMAEMMEECPTLALALNLYSSIDNQSALIVKGDQVTEPMVDYFLSRLGFITKEEASNWKANGTVSDTKMSTKRALQELVDKYGKDKPWYKFW